MKVIDRFIKRTISLLLILSLVSMTLSGCDIGSKHLKMEYGENDNEDIVGWDDVDEGNITDWENASVQRWSDVDEFSDWVYAQMVFDDITDEYPVIECQVLDYRANGKYFDGEKIYTMVGDKFDVNSFITNYAIGTGVIIICVVLTVATAGGTTPICCFIAGAADGAVSYAIKGAAFGAAMNAVSTAIKSEGNIEESFYGALEGSSEGYKWGAIFGAISGGLNSTYCFTDDTPIMTDAGMVPIGSVSVGDRVCSYDEATNTYAYKDITQVSTNTVDSTIEITLNGETIESTLLHPYLTKSGWTPACELKQNDLVLASDHKYYPVSGIDYQYYDYPVTTYTVCVDDYHSYMVGQNGFVVHNRCNINSDYAGKTFELKDPELAAKYPNGVPFTEAGYPDFSAYAKETVKFELPSSSALKADTCLTGNNLHDFKLANKAMGFKETPAGYTWHHNEDMMTLQLIPTDLHMAVRHTGGASLIRELLTLIP